MSNPSIMLYVPFALNGKKNTIQVTRQTNQDEEDATWSDGFPDVTMIKESVGGKAPKGLDFNGVFYSLSADTVHRQSGKQIQYDATYSANIGGYSKGAIIQSTDLSKFWISTVDGNLTDPDSTSASGWSRFAYTPVATSTTLGTVKLADNLTSTEKDTALTANQGRILASMMTSNIDHQWIGSTLVQWGKIEIATNKTTDIKLPINFPNNALTSFACFGSVIPQGNSYAIGSDVYLDRISVTMLSSSSNATFGIRWFAIGN